MRKKKLGRIMAIALAVTFGMGPIYAPVTARAEDRDVEKQLEQEEAFEFEESAVLDELREDAETLPSSYDLRHVPLEGGGEENYVTPVKLQNPFGTCWGFGAVAAAETNLLSSGIAQAHGYDVNTLDFSEKHLAYFANGHVENPDDSQYGEGRYFRNLSYDQEKSSSYRYNTGGHAGMVANAFTSGAGPILEKRYDNSGNLVTDEMLAYKGKRGEKAYWEAATQYDDEGQPVEDSYRSMPVWYSDLDDWSMPEEYHFHQDFYMKDMLCLPDPAGTDEFGDYEYNQDAVNAIRQQISKYHRAVAVSFCAESYLPGQNTSDKKYMSKNWAHYTNTSEYSNHLVCIVGYDDNYPRENFDSSTAEGGSAMPEGNGAFLVKNSWGSELNEFPTNGLRHWGLLDGQDVVPYNSEAKANPGNKATGYFWISYYDRSLCDPEVPVFEDQDKSLGYYIEQTDLMNTGIYLMNMDEGIMMANVLTAEGTSVLREVSLMSSTPGSKVTYEVYLLGEEYKNPRDGMLIETGETSFEYGGYHRIKLNSSKVLTKGQKFSVVVHEEAEFGDCIAVSYAYNSDELNNYDVSVVNEGESFYYDGSAWLDLSVPETKSVIFPDYASLIELDNFPIKAYLEPITYTDGEETRVFDGCLTIHHWADGNPGKFEVVIGQDKTLSAEFRGLSADMPDSWNPVFAWEAEDESMLSVSTFTPGKGNAVLKGLKPGVTRLYVYAGDKNADVDSAHPENYGIRVLTIVVKKPEVKNFWIENTNLKVTYTGKPIEPEVLKAATTGADDKYIYLTEGKDYKVFYENNINVGMATVIVAGIGEYAGQVTWNFEILPAENTFKAAGKTASVKYSDKAQTLVRSKVVAFTIAGQGAKTYTKVSGHKNITVDKATGKITIAKGLPVGSYSVVVNASAAGDKNHKAVTRKLTVKINVTAAENTLKVAGKTATVKYSDKAQTVVRSKAIDLTNAGQGTKTYSKASGNKNITVDKTGKITIAKGLKKGTYTIKVNVKASGTKNYKAATKQATVKIVIK